jgi:tRNA threonylcarbamoyladenosine biosynthesis protein TsaE
MHVDPDLFAVTVTLADAEATEKVGRWLAGHVERGTCLLLSGDIGAGKSHLCRAFIREKLGRYEDVPSPTFTLVQTYETADAEIWHADLYRLHSTTEVCELGLEDAFDTAICLIEWPDRLGEMKPVHAIELLLQPDGEGRKLTVHAPKHPQIVLALQTFWHLHG